MVRQRLKADERKARTLTRVTEVFAQKGFDGTTSADLARAAGVSEAMLYKLFGSKRRLYRAMIEHKLAEAGWGDVVADPSDDPEAFFTAMAEAIFARVEEDPDFVRLLLFSDLQGSGFAETFHEVQGGAVLAAVGDYVRARVADGRFRGDANPDVVAVAFLLTCWQYAVATKLFATDRIPRARDDEVIATLVGLFLRGVET